MRFNVSLDLKSAYVCGCMGVNLINLVTIINRLISILSPKVYHKQFLWRHKETGNRKEMLEKQEILVHLNFDYLILHRCDIFIIHKIDLTDSLIVFEFLWI